MRQKDDPNVSAYLEAENAYTAAMTADQQALRETLYKELLGRLKEGDTSTPYFFNGYYRYQKTEAGTQYPVLCRKRSSLDAPEEVVLDLNGLSQGQD